MTYPTADVITANLDAGTDNPALARSDLLDLVNKFNGLRPLPADLAASSGASMVGYANNGTKITAEQALDILYFGVANVRNPIFAGGAGSGNAAQDTAAFQAAHDSCTASGGVVYVPAGSYTLTPTAANYAALWVNKNNITIRGDGAASIIRVVGNSHVPVHVSSERNLDVVPAGAEVTNFTCENLCIVGTAVYQNYGLAYGRGILLRKVKNAIVRNNYVFDMSMIGICVEQGSGNFLIDGNIVGGCKYTAINFNGRCYQSIISNNICYGSDASVDSVSIQATGHSIIQGNTVYGSPGGYANCGGIMWGEGPYNGVGSVQGNLVKHCRFGIKAIYHGTCNINGNTVINCMTLGGIIATGGTVSGMTVSSSDNKISNNLLINNSPTQIDCSAQETLISDNKLLRLVTPTNPSGSMEPDAIIDVIPEWSIHVTAAGCSVINNTMKGSTRGIVIQQGVLLRNLHGNDVPSLAGPGLIAYESPVVPGTIIGLTDLFERRSAGNGVYQNRVFGNTKPSQGFWANGDLWDRVPAVVGQSLGECVIATVDTTTTAASAAGSNTITVAVAPSAASGNLLGVQLDNGTYHWTSATGVAGLVVTLAAAIPAGRSVTVGNPVNSTQWRPLATLA